MPVFAVIGTFNSEAIGPAIVTQYGANHFKFTPNVWFVPDTGTTKDVSDKIGLTTEVNGIQGTVLKFNAYSGRATGTVWT